MATIHACLKAAYPAAVLCIASPALAAQDSRAATHHTDTSSAPALRCWRGQPAPACRSFVITEIGFSSALATTSSTTAFRSRDFSDHATIEVGIMRNSNRSSALGATLLLGADATGGRFGAKARYRRWLNPAGLAVDVGAGVIVGNLPRVSRTATLTGDLALNFSDYGALVTGVEVARPNGRSRAALFGGARLGSKPGAIVTGLAIILAAIGALALATWTWE